MNSERIAETTWGAPFPVYPELVDALAVGGMPGWGERDATPRARDVCRIRLRGPRYGCDRNLAAQLGWPEAHVSGILSCRGGEHDHADESQPQGGESSTQPPSLALPGRTERSTLGASADVEVATLVWHPESIVSSRRTMPVGVSRSTLTRRST